jgi:hypothetical protein
VNAQNPYINSSYHIKLTRTCPGAYTYRALGITFKIDQFGSSWLVKRSDNGQERTLGTLNSAREYIRDVCAQVHTDKRNEQPATPQRPPRPTPQPVTGDLVWSDIACDRPTPPRWTGVNWTLDKVTRFAGSNFKRWTFIGTKRQPATRSYPFYSGMRAIALLA